MPDGPIGRGTAAARASSRAERLSLGAIVFVVLALIVLASMPALLLQRVERTNEELTRTTLRAYDAVNAFTVAMEQRIVATRSGWMSDDVVYDDAFESAVRRESAALTTIRDLAPGLGPAFQRDLRALLRYVQLRDSIAATIPGVGSPEYTRSLPTFDLLRDSLLLTAGRLQSDLQTATRARMDQEARWIIGQQLIALVLGVITLIAVLAVGRFALVQRRLRRRVQAALLEAERLRLEAEEGRLRLEQVTESRSRLLRGFTHDVKNPLGAARGYIDLLIDGIQGPLEDAQRRSLERARASLNAGLGLVDEMLELARAEGGHLEIVRAPVDLAELVTETTDESRPLAEAKGLHLTTTVDGPSRLVTDGRRVRQVLGNLLSNAIKYTPAGAITVSVLKPRRADDTRIGVAVSDTGPGIAPEQQALLFEEFVRLDPGGPSGGAGVGLTISTHLARALGGEITLESQVGQGSTFTLWLPLDA
ncbi:MAG TPA: HAMP domain-containing sensor histidine kinase [Longimicrobiales bacterium]